MKPINLLQPDSICIRATYQNTSCCTATGLHHPPALIEVCIWTNRSTPPPSSHLPPPPEAAWFSLLALTKVAMLMTDDGYGGLNYEMDDNRESWCRLRCGQPTIAPLPSLHSPSLTGCRSPTLCVTSSLCCRPAPFMMWKWRRGKCISGTSRWRWCGCACVAMVACVCVRGVCGTVCVSGGMPSSSCCPPVNPSPCCKTVMNCSIEQKDNLQNSDHETFDWTQLIDFSMVFKLWFEGFFFSMR